MSNDFLQLTISLSEFVEKYEGFKKELEQLIIFQPRDVASYKEEFNELNKRIISFLQQSFNNVNNRFYIDYRNAKPKRYNLGSIQYNNEHVREDIHAKIPEINTQLTDIEISDLLVNYSEELYLKRQNFTIEEKENFILMKLYDISKKGIKDYWCINYIYSGCGLKEDVDYEHLEITRSLSKKDFVVEYPGSTGALVYARLIIGGLKHAQNLDAKAFGLYSVGEEFSRSEQLSYAVSFEKLKQEIVTEMKEEFKNQNEFLTIGLDTLYQLIDESLLLIDSKLPQKTVKEGIIGKMFSKAKDKGMEVVIKMVWEKMKQDPTFSEWFADTAQTLKLN
ncbi:MAG: hypothetical protein JWM14_1494 [Chitinophagaceae bacterium]|nr:hypothetical protein [Chitinophagaceae bacterium]